MTIGASSTLINESGSTFNANNDNVIGGSTGTFSNLGTFAKNGSATTTRIDSAFNHSGALTIASNAILNLAGGGTSTGTITSSGFLDFGGGTYLLNSGTSTSPGGTIKVTAGTVNSSSLFRCNLRAFLRRGRFFWEDRYQERIETFLRFWCQL